MSTMRSDASRNHEAILTAAIAVLADAPAASMQEVADASGTGRTTLYRHFPDREALVAAIYARVHDEADATTVHALQAPRGADGRIDVLARLAADLAGFGDRYRFLQAHARRASARTDTPGGRLLLACIVDGQREGEIRGDLGADWLFEAIVAIIAHAAGFAFADGVTRSDAVIRTVRALLRGDAEARENGRTEREERS